MSHTTPASSERLEQLVGIGALLSTELSLEGVLDRVVAVAAHLIGARYAAIGVLGPDGHLLESFTTFGISAEEHERIGPPPRGHGILGLVISEARVIRLPDLMEHPSSFGFPPHHPPMHSFLGVPIVGRRGTFGNLYLTEKLGQAEFSDDDERIARLLATQTAAAVENARLHEESARLLEEVQQLHRSRERFFATVNHELRNALAATYGWAEMLVRRKDPATLPRAAFEVLESAEQAVALINDLLDLSRLDEDRLQPDFRDVDVAAIARRSIRRLIPAAEAKQVAINPDTGTGILLARTDPGRLEQILVNLLGNAVRHTPAGSTVVVRTRVDGERVVVEIDDQGNGIAAGEIERIFDIYVTKGTADARGTGLGLPLSRRLARLLGGELRAVYRAGEGGRFRLELPATQT